MKLIEKVERRLKQEGLTQEELARAIHVAPNRISKWKSGQGEPRPRHLLKMARFLGVSVDSLIDESKAELESAEDGLTEDERALLHVARIMGGGPREAIRRLVGGAAAAGVQEGDQITESPRYAKYLGASIMDVPKPSTQESHAKSKGAKSSHTPRRIE